MSIQAGKTIYDRILNVPNVTVRFQGVHSSYSVLEQSIIFN